MQIGKLRHRIKIQQQINTQNDYGALVTEWQDVVSCWAEVKPLMGKEYFTAQQVQSEVTVQIWLRYRAGIMPTMRVVFGERHFEIVEVLNYQGRSTALQLLCKEKVNG